jgi:GT2 family glycosyltransferase
VTETNGTRAASLPAQFRRRLSVSICIPTYNRRQILLQTLESLKFQDEPPEHFEVVVGDDGSCDGTVEMASSLRTPYRLRIFTQANAGPAAATNLAARHAENDILILLDDDQIASPQLIGAHIRAHQKYGDVLVQGLFPLAEACRGRGASLLYERHLLNDLAPLNVEHPFSPNIWSANVSVRWTTWERVGGLDETFREYGGEDTDFGIRVAALGCPVIFIPDALSHHVHVVSYRAAQRQPYHAGRAMVRLAEKFDRPLESFSGGATRSRVDRILGFGWRLSPSGVVAFGKLLTLGLRASDLLASRSAQLFMARAVHRLYKVGGITTELNALRRRQAASQDRALR